MTTGSILNDGRLTVETSCGPMCQYGTFYSRTWNGGNGSHSDDHPYSMAVVVKDDTLLQWSFSADPSVVYSGTPESCGFAPTFSYGAYPVNHELIVINRLANKVRGHDFNAAVNIGELKESIKMVGGTARTLALSFTNLKKGNFKAALRYLGIDANRSKLREVQRDFRHGAGNAWLGLQYGWLPLIGAVDDAAKACASRLRPRTATFKTLMKATDGLVYGAGGNFSAVGYAKRSYHLVWKISEDEQFTTLEEFGFLEPELVAWELMPYSFVADWFVPIGNFLQARSVLNKLHGRFVRSERWRASVRLGTSPYFVVHSGSAFKHDAKLVRTVGDISEMPLPAPLPINPFSLAHMVSGIALLQNAFKS